MSYREDFKIPTPKISAPKVPNPVKPIQNAANTVKNVPNTIKDKALAPVWNFLKNIWDKFKYFVSLICCLCITSCCFSLGIPQAAFKAVSQAAE
jgi:hypothetical protein